MKKGFNYFVEKSNLADETIYIEFKNRKGYQITPKTDVLDAISVNKIVFISPTLTEKLVKQKINRKMKQLLQKLQETDDGNSDPSGIKLSIVEAEKLRLNIINKYAKYLGNTFQSLTLKKMNIIIKGLKYKYLELEQKQMAKFYYLNNQADDEEEKKGRGR